MSLSNIKAALYRYCDLSWPALTQLKAWMKRSKSFNGFDVESLSNPSLRIAQATNGVGLVIGYCLIEQAVMVNKLALNPQATGLERSKAGESIEDEIVRQAELAGVSRLLMVLPDNMRSEPDEKWIRIVERKIAPAVNTYGIGCPSPSPATYLN